jgi:hypothetical protein
MSDRLISANKLRKDVLDLPNCYNGFSDTYDKAMIIDLIDEQPPVDAEPMVWIPITSRPMDEEERLEWSEKLGYDLEDDEALIYTSQLPDDGQEVLVCGYGGVRIDTFMNDPDYGCYFVENEDMDGIVAWMPLPKPYGEEEREDAD